MTAGLGQVGATGLTDFFQFWCYVTPIGGAIISDQFLGKYNTIVYSAYIYLIGVLILFLTSLPTSIEHGAGTGGLIVAMIVIGIGTGGIKSNVSPLIAEQNVPLFLIQHHSWLTNLLDTVTPNRRFVWRRMEKG